MHASHRLKIYTKKRHVIAAFFVFLVPILLLIGLGGIANLKIEGIGIGIGISLYRLLLAYVLSVIMGVSVAVLVGYSPWVTSVIPVFDVLQNIPSFALIPVFALFMGYTNTMAIIFAATSIIWPILFYVLNAIRTAHSELNEAATVFGATGLKRIFHYLIPLSFPAIITSSIVGISIGWEAVIGVEIIGLKSGIGVFLSRASSLDDRTTLIAGILAILIFVFSINKLVWMPLLKKTQYYAE